jgi:hypothetical protein
MTSMPAQSCTYVFPDRHTCGSPALRGESRCYYHHPTRPPSKTFAQNPRRGFRLTAPTNRRDFQSALSQIIQRLAANQLDTRRAGILLYSLQVAGMSLPMDAPQPPSTPPPMRKSHHG